MPTMLPSAPKSLGRLGDVFRSALAATAGQTNPLNFGSADSGVVILVDGLGSSNLKAARGHARFLSSMESTGNISTVFPTTTAAALTSLGTGLQPSEHGIVGYRVLDRALDRPQNLLSGWTSFHESDGWRSGTTVSEESESVGVTTNFIGPSAYERSGFTNIIMPAAKYHAADELASRFEIAAKLVTAKGHLVYLYIPELDQIAHARGVESFEWLAQLESLDSLVKNLASRVGPKVGLALTADHGVVDVPKHGHLELGEIDLPGLKFAGGDTRNAFLYFDSDEQTQRAQLRLQAELGDSCWVVKPEELVVSGWMAAPNGSAQKRLPDLYVLARKKVALYHRQFSSHRSYAMVGHHGSISHEELTIPLLRFGAWA